MLITCLPLFDCGADWGGISEKAFVTTRSTRDTALAMFMPSVDADDVIERDYLNIIVAKHH